jgi:hypothetical protein
VRAVVPPAWLVAVAVVAGWRQSLSRVVAAAEVAEEAVEEAVVVAEVAVVAQRLIHLLLVEAVELGLAQLLLRQDQQARQL